MSSRSKNVISKASSHTIKKFELIEEYIKSWAQKLMLNGSCNGLIFIDCMCNSGIYIDEAGEQVKGTAVRVSEALPKAGIFALCFSKRTCPRAGIVHGLRP